MIVDGIRLNTITSIRLVKGVDLTLVLFAIYEFINFRGHIIGFLDTNQTLFYHR
jgi:hypothetical protein